jgi:hypothetical protein
VCIHNVCSLDRAWQFSHRFETTVKQLACIDFYNVRSANRAILKHGLCTKRALVWRVRVVLTWPLSYMWHADDLLTVCYMHIVSVHSKSRYLTICSRATHVAYIYIYTAARVHAFPQCMIYVLGIYYTFYHSSKFSHFRFYYQSSPLSE